MLVVASQVSTGGIAGGGVAVGDGRTAGGSMSAKRTL